ncbi:MAG TPA: bifunctional DNA-formamidopyrimidine glycosylase/DNA-(apurinic or apyrimidinic site) lyase [Anaerolineae bacterium]|nr:bifunctional DNA-formamidopyrimidine glycosylase/DNA-(apurinic or apyrimidinic site) lyase [Anaerolineae bacterium]
MPELPEVENIVRGLRPLLIGRTIARARVLWERTVARPSLSVFGAEVQGRRVLSVGRRGKYALIELAGGWLLFHLKMSGRLRWGASGEPDGPYTRLVLDLSDGYQLRFDDPRKFGRAYLVGDHNEVTRHLGPEPLDEHLSLDDFRALLARRHGRLKPVLVDQRFLAGVGNIYADEILFCARLHPLRLASTLADHEGVKLYFSLRHVLEQAIVGHGTTLDDGGYVDSKGDRGQYQDQIAVYRRTGQPCRCCGNPIQRIVIGQRSAHFCPGCQPSPDGF